MPLYDFRCSAGHDFERHVKLAHFDDRQKCDCGQDAERQVCAPRILSDYMTPAIGADGKMHDSKAAYRASLSPSGNPKGERFLEVGNETITEAPVKFDRKKRRDDIKAAIQDVKYGRVAPIPAGPPA